MDDARPRVLIVEDDDDIAAALSRGLVREGYDAVVAPAADKAVDLAGGGCDALIVDVMLGAICGIDLVRRLRAAGINVPIIMLSALSSVEDRASGLAAGADDYVAKPFAFAELVARLRVQERRRREVAKPLGLSALRYDPDLREVGVGKDSIRLTEREGNLLAFLITHAGKVVSRGEIFDTLWLGHGRCSENVVDVYIGYLRRKLAPLSTIGIDIRTVRGRGFMLTEFNDE